MSEHPVPHITMPDVFTVACRHCGAVWQTPDPSLPLFIRQARAFIDLHRSCTPQLTLDDHVRTLTATP